MKLIVSNFGEFVREKREKRGLSVNQLGLYSDLSPSTISKIENGLRNPKPETIKKLARGLKVDYDELMFSAGDLKTTDKDITSYEKEEGSNDPLIKEINELAELYGYDPNDRKFLDIVRKSLEIYQIVNDKKSD